MSIWKSFAKFKRAIFGTLADGNYSEIEYDGTIKMNGDATVWKDINFDPKSIKQGPVNPPTVGNLDSTGILISIFEDTSVVQSIHGSLELQHDYKEGSDIVPHIHWTPTTTDSGDVQWFLELYIKEGSTTLYSGTINVIATSTETAWEEIRSDFSAIDGTNLGIGSQISFRLYRDSRVSNSNDTLGADVGVFTVGFHYEIDTIGSRSITSK